MKQNTTKSNEDEACTPMNCHLCPNMQEVRTWANTSYECALCGLSYKGYDDSFQYDN